MVNNFFFFFFACKMNKFTRHLTLQKTNHLHKSDFVRIQVPGRKKQQTQKTKGTQIKEKLKKMKEKKKGN